jgi:hypothetical protein
MSEQDTQMETEQASPDDVCNACGNPRRKHPMSWPKAWDGRGLHCGGDFGDDTPLSRVTHHAPASGGTPRGVVRDADEGAALLNNYDSATAHYNELVEYYCDSQAEAVLEIGAIVTSTRQALLAALRASGTGTPAPTALDRYCGNEACGFNYATGEATCMKCGQPTTQPHTGTPAPTGGAASCSDAGVDDPEGHLDALVNWVRLCECVGGSHDPECRYREKRARVLAIMYPASGGAAPTGERAGGAVRDIRAGLIPYEQQPKIGWSARRNRVDHWTPAERAIQDAVDAVEAAGADIRLTDAVVLLADARTAVADFVDAQIIAAARAATPAREGGA